MQYIFHKAASGNFGDDLNPWLWPQLFNIENIDSNKCFFGIGSILFNENPIVKSLSDIQKIVFGTGVRPSTQYKKLPFDSTWDIRFLRGPLSANCYQNEYKYIADAAYAFRKAKNFPNYENVEKKYDVSVMPYYRSVTYFNWEKICKQLGYNYISPLSPEGVEDTLKEIAASKRVITEAMHGAILADILRVPWHRFILTTPFTEGTLVSEFKWMDWQFSINEGYVNSTKIKFYSKGRFNKGLFLLTNGKLNSESYNNKFVREEIIEKLSLVSDYYLSSNRIITEIDERMEIEISRLKQQLTEGFI